MCCGSPSGPHGCPAPRQAPRQARNQRRPLGGVAASCPGNPHSLPVSRNVAAAGAARLRVPQETASEPARDGSTPNKTLLRRKPQYSEARGVTGAVPNIRRRRLWVQRLGCSVSVLFPDPATVAGDLSPPCLSLSACARSLAAIPSAQGACALSRVGQTVSAVNYCYYWVSYDQEKITC